VNNRRTLQLLDTGATKIATGCPFCQTMLTDGGPRERGPHGQDGLALDEVKPSVEAAE
jgi:Fe-S oxidoreductase